MAAAAERRRRITIIDDHAEFLDLMEELLAEPYEVAVFSGHELTPDDIVDSAPDLLIIDLRLGTRDLQGPDIVTLVRAHSHLRMIPIIVCSADAAALKAHAEKLLAGNTAVLAKPFTLDRLEEVVHQGLTSGFPGAEVRSADECYRSLLASSVDPAFAADQRGRYLDANDAALDLLKLTLEELRALSVRDLVAEDEARIEAEWQRYQSEGLWHGPLTISIPGRGTQRVLATGRVIDDRGRPVYVSWLRSTDGGVVAG